MIKHDIDDIVKEISSILSIQFVKSDYKLNIFLVESYLINKGIEDKDGLFVDSLVDCDNNFLDIYHRAIQKLDYFKKDLLKSIKENEEFSEEINNNLKIEITW